MGAQRCGSDSCVRSIFASNRQSNAGYINGKFTRGCAYKGDHFPVYNPANGELLTSLPRMGPAEVEEAARACSDSWAGWKNRTAKDRATVLSKMASLMVKYEDDLAAIITLEAGKPLAEAKGEVAYARSFLEFYAEEATRVFGEILQSPMKGKLCMVRHCCVMADLLCCRATSPDHEELHRTRRSDHAMEFPFRHDYSQGATRPYDLLRVAPLRLCLCASDGTCLRSRLPCADQAI